ncbi:MAG TPA: trypsin-like peptidase domain-containing protein [Streptosporangiaceae bacterium]|nr:trypsin-like peptidase domain-containing protein [Streptosporangiaceae bacterium]
MRPGNPGSVPPHQARPHGRLRGSRWFRWLAKPSARLVSTTVLAVLAIIFATPADGGTTSLAARFAKAVGLLPRASQVGTSFGGTPAVGALFKTSNGKLGTHFCTASVVNSTHGNLLITAAHCVTGDTGTIAFVPGYVNGSSPYGVWYVTKVFTDDAWNASSSDDDDVAFAEVAQHGSSTPIEDVTGAEQLGIGLPAEEQAKVIGYPNGASEPVICENWTRPFSSSQMEFDCAGYPDGTSGGPFLIRLNRSTGQGTVVGVIGGYEQGGYTPAVSYSVLFGQQVQSLYRTAESGS